MDLRRQLVTWLGALLLGLMLATVALNLLSLRAEVANEVRASSQLALALLEAGRLDGGADGRPGSVASPRLDAILAQGGLRHIALERDGAGARQDGPPPTLGGRLAPLFGLAAGEGQLVRLGGQGLRISPNPASEIDERLNDLVRLWSTLLFFSGAALLLAWWAVHRALAPVRALEAGLQRLADGQAEAGLPSFALREFSRIAAAIDQLAAALAQARQEQQRLAHQLIRVQEDERRTLAMELHDDMGQTLTAIGLTAAYLERHAGQLDSAAIGACAGELRRDVRSCGGQLRAMLSRLRPHGLDGGGLAPALRQLLGGWQQRAAAIDFAVLLPAELPPLDKEQSLVLYRVVQEALTNVVRHSQARHCQVELVVEAGVLRVRIEDDGCGLAAAAAGSGQGSGLSGMAERLRMVGGQMRLAPGPGRGLRLLASLPLAA